MHSLCVFLSRNSLRAAVRCLFVFIFVLAGTPPALFADDDEDEEEQLFDARDLTPEMLASITRAVPGRHLPVVSGERMIFSVGWGMFDVAEAVMEVEKTERAGEPAWRVSLETATNAFADRFYRVRNTTTSWLDEEMVQSVHYENIQREGRRDRDIVVDFDWSRDEAQYTDRLAGESRDPIALTPGTLDPLGITLFVRSLPLEVGSQFIIPTTNGRELFLTQVDVAEQVTRNFRFGRREALVLRPDIKDLGGVFRRSGDAEILFYVSDDEERLLLRMESSVAVGRFWVELLRIERPGEEPDTGTAPERRARRRGR